MKPSKFQVYNLTVRNIYCTVCSPLIVRFISVAACLTPFTPSTSPLEDELLNNLAGLGLSGEIRPIYGT